MSAVFSNACRAKTSGGSLAPGVAVGAENFESFPPRSELIRVASPFIGCYFLRKRD